MTTNKEEQYHEKDVVDSRRCGEKPEVCQVPRLTGESFAKVINGVNTKGKKQI